MRTSLTLLAATALAAIGATPAFAQQQVQPAAAAGAERAGPEDVRVNQLIIYGDDPCPESRDPNEVTVCARLPDNDRYRVPEGLRNNPDDPASRSWAGRATELSYVGRTGTDSCSTVGGGGFTGCFNQLVNQAMAERRAAGGDVNWTRMIAEARERRDARIQEQAQAEEDEARRREAAAPTPTPAPQPVP